MKIWKTPIPGTISICQSKMRIVFKEKQADELEGKIFNAVFVLSLVLATFREKKILKSVNMKKNLF